MRWDETEIAGFLDKTDTAETAYFFPLFGNPELRGVYEDGITVILNFQEPFLPVDLNTGVIERSSPSAVVRPSDVPELMNGDIFVIRGVEYNVTSFEPDGAGMTIIKLSKRGV